MRTDYSDLFATYLSVVELVYCFRLLTYSLLTKNRLYVLRLTPLYARYLYDCRCCLHRSCYDDTDLSEEDKLWLISIDAVNNKQDIMKMSQSSISSDKMQGKTPDEVMNEYGFDDDQKNWVTLMVNTIRQAKASNNPDLPIIAGGTNNGIPSEAYNDATFAKLINEAEKYLGYPYVFGGSSPSTSFDCSGFVCWVYTHSGVHNLPRTTAQGIYNQCTRVSASEAKPGDLVFFQGTYNAGETVTHIGIYVGQNRMLHFGSPIQYTSIDTSYWRSHFYSYGRL